MCVRDSWLWIGICLCIHLTSFGQSCQNDTTFTDVIFLVDNSGSIDDSEYASLESIILRTIDSISILCPFSRQSVVHYGGIEGKSTTIEYPLSTNPITTVNRQFCTQRSPTNPNICLGGAGGDDLNNAIGDLLFFFGNGSLDIRPGHNLSVVILTDAFSGSPVCTGPACSVILPLTNVNRLKQDIGAQVTVVGISQQAAANILGIYASPGGEYNSPLSQTECVNSVDGCDLPRKYIPIEFSTPGNLVASDVLDCVNCGIGVVPPVMVDAGDTATICGNLGELATLSAMGSIGAEPYSYQWSDSLGSGPVKVVQPTIDMTYFVTITDANGCTAVDDVTVIVADCAVDCDSVPRVQVDAGVDQSICGNLGEAATLTAVGSVGRIPYTYEWSTGSTSEFITVSPNVSTDYTVTITDGDMCTNIDTVRVDVRFCDPCDANAGRPQAHEEICTDRGRAFLPTERNIGVFFPSRFEEVFVLTDETLTVIDFSIGARTFVVQDPGIYRIHTLIAEVNSRSSPDFLDLGLITRGESELFIITNCIMDHGICADFDYPGRVFVVLQEDDMMCMPFENSINLCSDGIDNDEDGLVDCDDPDCITLVNCQENTLIACNDLYDNDEDGLVDCFDPDCFAFKRCFEKEEKCDDGVDNDGDGLIDCADSSCFESIQCFETTAYTCLDGIDNDRDGLVDCEEETCQRFIVCAESTMLACQDGLDNDRDGLVDCEDDDCRKFFSEVCTPEENSAALCGDGIDNDADGLVDCADPGCGITMFNSSVRLEGFVTKQDATCPNNANGQVVFDVPAGTQDYEYSIDGGVSYQSDPIFSGVTPGVYQIRLRTVATCEISGVPVIISQETCREVCNNGIDDDGDGDVDCDDNECGVSQAIPTIVQNPACPRLGNGAVRLFYTNATGGVNGLQYSIDNGVRFQTSPIFRNLSGGTYQVVVRTAAGCTATEMVSIVDPACPEICNNGIDDDLDGLTDCDDDDCQFILTSADVDIIDPECPDTSSGRIEVTRVETGFTYKIGDAPFQASPIFDSLSAGQYTVVIRNLLGCVATTEVILEDPHCVEDCTNGIDDDGDGIVDCDDPDCAQSAECVLQGSTFEICGNGLDDDGDGLSDCDDPDCGIGNDFAVVVTPSCPDLLNGAITVVPADNRGYRFSLSGSAFQLNNTFEDLPAGNYDLSLINESFCDTSLIVEVPAEECQVSGAIVGGTDLDIRVWLQGAYDEEQQLMRTDLNDEGYLPGQLPATFFGARTPAGQPYGDAPWFYEGAEGDQPLTEEGLFDYDPQVVDWVLVSLRPTMVTDQEIYRLAGLLYSDGHIEFVSSIQIDERPTNQYFILIEHRNHLPIMTETPVPVVNGVLTWDFRAANSFTGVFGIGQVTNASGGYMMAGGNGELIEDLSSDIDINVRDLNYWLLMNGANSGYFLQDYDLNGDINIKDRLLWE
ncbi:MAG: vWA domain-containing protein [Bacteroidota bacterium]